MRFTKEGKAMILGYVAGVATSIAILIIAVAVVVFNNVTIYSHDNYTKTSVVTTDSKGNIISEKEETNWFTESVGYILDLDLDLSLNDEFKLK